MILDQFNILNHFNKNRFSPTQQASFVLTDDACWVFKVSIGLKMLTITLLK
ncbi:hypothetical protein EJK55_2089 [Moraxella catarrhalis]|uniref:Uncharacterized protein n=1 Tax=Moraxella catarrhalis TaxID=480 RepID=A0A3S9QF56_MORCA|nr:hypothetical protein MCR_1225 [Moraxella catarrhalis BBH18]AZQ87494.1 hypothetical protein EJK52_1275 [Moraxella catarrhalis]EGE16228.1 hypothetical protein E9O_03063 [Moraxella catarrhalis 12P80B1]EKF83186.1 hypothetical protein MCRH_1294 [Moraxella catarrhalis RH4]AZQ89393.1 hypothetical protein EJK50_1336 [Moraxella catarrhalis]